MNLKTRVLSLAAGLTAALLPGQNRSDIPDIARMKDYQFFRSSSSNPDLESNDDSRRSIPGETIELANLNGPGVITHLWVTVAANEYGWQRLLRLRVYYDGS